MGIITFNGISSKDYGIEIEHPPRYVYPERDYTVYNVLGSNSQYILDNGCYKPVTKSYDISFPTPFEKFTEYSSGVSRWLHSGSGYCRLEDSYEPDIYRMAYYKEDGEFENIYNGAGKATINFVCRPERFLKIGDEEYSDIYIINHYEKKSPYFERLCYPCYPKFRINIYRYNNVRDKKPYSGNLYIKTCVNSTYENMISMFILGLKLSNMTYDTDLIIDSQNSTITTNPTKFKTIISSYFPKILDSETTFVIGTYLDEDGEIIPPHLFGADDEGYYTAINTHITPRWWVL